MLFYKDLNDYVTAQKARLDEIQKGNIPERAIIKGVYAALENDLQYTITTEVNDLEVDAMGIAHDRHRGSFHASTGREKELYHKKTIIRQHRHLCIVSSYDCQILSNKLGVEITPQLLGANLLIDPQEGESFSISEMKFCGL